MGKMVEVGVSALFLPYPFSWGLLVISHEGAWRFLLSLQWTSGVLTVTALQARTPCALLSTPRMGRQQGSLG